MRAATGLDLAGRAVLVTGAERGLGPAYAESLARHGAQVVVHDAGVDQDGGNPEPTCAVLVGDERGKRLVDGRVESGGLVVGEQAWLPRGSAHVEWAVFARQRR